MNTEATMTELESAMTILLDAIRAHRDECLVQGVTFESAEALAESFCEAHGLEMGEALVTVAETQFDDAYKLAVAYQTDEAITQGVNAIVHAELELKRAA